MRRTWARSASAKRSHPVQRNCGAGCTRSSLRTFGTTSRPPFIASKTWLEPTTTRARLGRQPQHVSICLSRVGVMHGDSLLTVACFLCRLQRTAGRVQIASGQTCRLLLRHASSLTAMTCGKAGTRPCGWVKANSAVAEHQISASRRCWRGIAPCPGRRVCSLVMLAL